MRWLVIARLENAGLGANQIASVTGFPLRRIQFTLDLPAYQEWRNSRIAGSISAIDAILAEDATEMRTALRELVPAAIYRLERCLNSEDNAIALRAATEIIDRDARFTKAQNIEIKHVLIPGKELESARKLARELRKHTIDLQPISQPLLVSDTEHKN